MSQTPVAETALSAVVTLVALPNGAGDYWYDFSASGAVRIGIPDPSQAGPVPCVYVWPGEMGIAPSAEMGSWDQELMIQVWARVPSLTSDPADRAKAGLRALNDLLLALRSNRSLSSAVLDAPASGSVWVGADFGLDGIEGCTLTLNPWWLALPTEGA